MCMDYIFVYEVSENGDKIDLSQFPDSVKNNLLALQTLRDTYEFKVSH